MADIRINALATTAASTASDDFIAVDGSANGTRKLNAYSPTFGGNLTVSGTGTFNGSSVAFANSAAGSGPNIKFENLGGSTQLSETASSSFYYKAYTHNFLSLVGTSLMALSNTGNLTVSGGTITSGSGTLTLNSSANTVVLQSAGTTALTLDSSQNATFAGKATATRLIANSQWVAASAGTGALSATANAGVQLTGTGAVNDITLVNKNGDNVMVVPTGTTNATFAGSIAIGNTVAAAASVASTHKVTISIGGSTYYLLATNV